MKKRIENTRSAAAEDGCIRATFLKALAEFGSLSALLRHQRCANNYENNIMLENSPIMLGIMPDAFKHLLCSALCLMLSSTYYAQHYA